MAVNGVAAAQDVADLKISTAALATAMGTRVGALEGSVTEFQETADEAVDIANSYVDEVTSLVDTAEAFANDASTAGTEAAEAVVADRALRDGSNLSDTQAQSFLENLRYVGLGTDAAVRPLNLKLGDIVSVKDFKLPGDANDTASFQRALAAIPDNGVVFGAPGTAYIVTGEIDTSGTTIGKKIVLFGSVILLNDNAATITIGQQGSGILGMGGEIRAFSGFTGKAITLAPQARASDAGRSFFLNDLNLYCNTLTGTAVSARVTVDDTRIVGLSSFGLTIKGFEFGIHCNSAAPTGIGFVNDLSFHRLRIPGNTAYGIVIEASASGANECGGISFNDVMTQWISGATIKNIWIKDARCQGIELIGVKPWDISGAASVVVDDQGTQTVYLGRIPSSGGVFSPSPSAVGIIAQDSGNEKSKLLLGTRTITDNVENQTVQTFDTADLTSLDVRNGAVMVEGTVASGTRLTNITNLGEGQLGIVAFGGDTLLSNAFGGTGEILTRDRQSRTPPDGAISLFLKRGANILEVGEPAGIIAAATAADLANAASTANTVGKFTGKLYWDSTNRRAKRAAGAAAASAWQPLDGALLGSATIDPASLALGASSSIATITINGAALGDFVSASFGVDLAGVRISAWVSATNTVSYYFTNENGTNPTDLASSTLRFRVIPKD